MLSVFVPLILWKPFSPKGNGAQEVSKGYGKPKSKNLDLLKDNKRQREGELYFEASLGKNVSKTVS
jgi:hypothetical protein